MTDCIRLVSPLVADGSTPDGDGIVWTIQGLAGWWDSPSMRQATLEVQPQGEVITVARQNGRAIVLTLVAHAQTIDAPLGSALCFTAIASCAAAFAAIYATVPLEVVDPVSDLSADVYLVGSIKKEILGNSVAVRFQVPLLAPDPTFV